MTVDAQSVASGQHGGRARRPGPRRAYLGAIVLAGAIAVIVVLAIRPGAGASAPGLINRPLTRKYGHPASWIKIPEPPKVKLARATAGSPALNAMEGYPVEAKLPTGSARMFVEGPSVPSWVSTESSEGKLVSGQNVPSTFTVSFSSVHGTVPLSAADFTLITYQGKLLHPRVATGDGGALPASLPDGRSFTLRVSAPLTEGDGEIRWAPAGRKILVSYFWTLEFD